MTSLCFRFLDKLGLSIELQNLLASCFLPTLYVLVNRNRSTTLSRLKWYELTLNQRRQADRGTEPVSRLNRCNLLSDENHKTGARTKFAPLRNTRHGLENCRGVTAVGAPAFGQMRRLAQF
jgi:hypothetical protein